MSLKNGNVRCNLCDSINYISDLEKSWYKKPSLHINCLVCNNRFNYYELQPFLSDKFDENYINFLDDDLYRIQQKMLALTKESLTILDEIRENPKKLMTVNISKYDIFKTSNYDQRFLETREYDDKLNQQVLELLPLIPESEMKKSITWIANFHLPFNSEGNTSLRVRFVLGLINETQFRTQIVNNSILINDLCAYTLSAIYRLLTNGKKNLESSYDKIIEVFNRSVYELGAEVNLGYLPTITKSSSVTFFKYIPQISFIGHQEYAIREICNKTGSILYFGTGGGKSFIAVYSIWLFLEEFPDRYVLIYTPKSLLGNMNNNSIKHFGKPLPPRVIVRSYNSILSFDYNYDEAKDSFLILDEIHYIRTKIKGDSGKMAEMMVNLSILASKRLGITATMIVNDLMDLRNFVNFCEGRPFFMASEKDDMIRKIRTYTIYEPLLEERIGFPKVNMVIEKFIMSPKLLAKYEKFEAEESDPFLIKSSLLCNESKEKLEYVLDLIRGGQKLTIYSPYLEKGLDLIINKLPMNIRFRVITGDTTADNRMKYIDEFNSDELDVLFISNASNTGIDLKNSDLIFFGLPYTKSAFDQIMGRVVRYHSHTHAELKSICNIYILITIKPEDVALFNSIVNNKEIPEIRHKISTDLRKYIIILEKENLTKNYNQLLNVI